MTDPNIELILDAVGEMLREQSVAFKAQIEAVIQDRDREKGEIANVIGKASAALVELSDKVEEIAGSVASLSDAQTAMMSKLADQDKALDRFLDVDLEQIIEDAKSDIRVQVGELHSELATSLRAELADHDSRVSELAHKQSDATLAADTALEELRANLMRHYASRDDIELISAEVSATTSAVSEHLQQISDLRALAGDLSVQINEGDANVIEALTSRIVSMNDERAEEIRFLVNKVDALHAANAEIVSRLSDFDFDARINAIKNDLFDLERCQKDQVTAISDQAQLVSGLSAKLDSEVSRLSTQVDYFNADATGRIESAETRLHKSISDANSAVLAKVNATVAEAIKPINETIDGLMDTTRELAENDDGLRTALFAARGEFDAGLKAALDRVPELAPKTDLGPVYEAIKAASEETAEGVVGVAEALRGEIADTASTVLDALRTRYDAIENWARGGAEYKEYAMVRHAGGLWQASRRTGAEPGRSDDWVLLSDGVRDVRVAANDDALSLQVELASGRIVDTAIPYQMPIPAMRGVYDSESAYRRFDAVVKDSHTFMALKDDPGPLGTNAWVCIGHRGKAGKNGPSIEQVLDRLRPEIIKTLQPEIADLVALAVHDA